MAAIMPANPLTSLRDLFVERVLSLEKTERVAVAWSFGYFFCILSSYYMMRPMRETMGVESGAETIPYLFTTTFFVMLLVAPIFGWVASRFARRTFLPWIYYFFVANIFIFYAAFSYADANELPIVWIGRVFFVWISIFNLFVVSVFWSFMADIYSREQGRRLFGLISAGGSLGALLGPFATRALVTPLGFHNLLPIAATLLLISVFCISRLRRWVEREHGDEVVETAASQKPLGGSAIDGVKRIFGSRYFSSMAVISVLASLLGTALYMFVNDMVGQTIPTKEARTEFFGLLDGASNIFSLLFQLLGVRYAVRKLGVGLTLAIMPALSVVGFALLAMNPILLVVAIFQGSRRAVGFGFTKPTNDMLFSVVDDAAKYKTKNFIDTAVYRGGDLIGTWSVKFMWALGIPTISLILLPFAAIWTGIALWQGREYRRLAGIQRENEAS